MDRQQLRETIAASVGNPTSGPIAEALDTITDAVLDLAQPQPAKETRVTKPNETRNAETLP